MPRGLLLVLEGPEGAGKTTQLRRLAEWLATHGKQVIAVREPGGTVVGDEIRRILLDPQSDIVPRAEALLFMASRAQLVECEIRPAMERGTVVLVDRFFLATYAYQGVGRGIPEHDLQVANMTATQGLRPDLTLLMMLPVTDGLSRANQRGGPDRMEQADIDFHNRVARAFETFSAAEWQAAHPECGPISIVDAVGSQDEVFARLATALHNRWPDIFPLIEQ
ncbi:MAG TPA: dTMP kinase [Gemmatimonadaceae bacterium]